MCVIGCKSFHVLVREREAERERETEREGGKERQGAVSYTHLRAHETDTHRVCRLLLEKGGGWGGDVGLSLEMQ